MNTKQVEELTGISRQNIRYYERQGLLEPVRETQNAYRDYSEEDVRRLKLIKMLRMLDMPLKEIESVLSGEVNLKEAVVQQQENLQKQQKQLQAAIEVCTSIHKEKSETVDVDSYLDKMEHMSRNGSIFAKFVDDYKQVALEEQQRQFSFYATQVVNTAGVFEKELRRYAAEHGMKFKLLKGGMYPEFTFDALTYTAVCVLEEEQETKKAATRIVCSRESKEELIKEIPESRRRFLQGIHSISVNIKRHKWKSILNVVVSLLIVVVMAFYLGNLTSTKQQLKELPKALPVSGQVWNVCGENSSGLFIPERVLEAVYQSSNIRDIAECADLQGYTQEGGQEGTGEEYWLQGVNRLDCINGLQEENITWAKGYDWSKFQKSKNVCILSKTVSESQGVKIGDELTLSMERYIMTMAVSSLEKEELKPIQMEVAGICDFSKLEKTELDTDVTVPEVVLPLDYVKQIYVDNDKTYFASSLSFMIKNPMKLNALKKELKDAGVQSVIQGSQFAYTGVGMKMDDSIFIQSAVSLEKSLSLLEAFLPFILLVVILIGYIVPHLLLQGRREEYAIMRALGTGRRRCTILFFTEQILLAALGGAAGAAVGLLLGASDLGQMALVWVVFLVCYMLGAGTAMWLFGRFSVAAVLSHRD